MRVLDVVYGITGFQDDAIQDDFSQQSVVCVMRLLSSHALMDWNATSTMARSLLL